MGVHVSHDYGFVVRVGLLAFSYDEVQVLVELFPLLFICSVDWRIRLDEGVL